VNFLFLGVQTLLTASVADPDPDPPDPRVFGPPGSVPDLVVRGMDPDPFIIKQK
jgi:hypothetical protein